MKIKKYTAKTMPEAMKEIRKDFGTEAVILQSKEVKKGGFLGMFKKSFIEVVAGIDPEPLSRQKSTRAVEVISQDKQPQKTVNMGEGNQLRQDIQHLQRLIEVQGRQNKQLLPPTYQLAYEHLLAQEISPSIAEQLINKVKDSELGPESFSDLPSLLLQVKQQILHNVKQIDVGFIYKHPIIQFVGPTGVGKTTTIAKIAAKLSLEEKKKVAFITLDTYRIAAVDQLKTYAEILHIPVEVAYSTEDYRNAIKKFASYDVILVDTAGRNYRDDAYIKELKKWYASLDVTNYLVLSMTSKPNDMLDIFGRFQSLGISGVVFTKLDETRTYGNILNLSWENKIRIGYMTNGQDVPEDVIEPTAEQMSNLVIGDENDH